MTREVLRELARPRLFGTAGASHVEAVVRTRLEAAGLIVEAQPFRFSTWPGRFAVPFLGTVLMIAFGGAVVLLLGNHATKAAATLAAAIVLLLPVPFLAGPAVMRLPFGRATGVNLLATRPGARPRFLVIAHRDSKSQPVPLGLRIAAAAVVVFALLAATGMALAGVIWPALLLCAAGLAASAVLLLCGVGNASPGALDNATGLAALLELAARERSGDVAFLVTDAEELALAGARAAACAWAAAGTRVSTGARASTGVPAARVRASAEARNAPGGGSGCEAVINLDGLDDTGPLRILVGRGRVAVRRAAPLREALEAAARERGLDVAVRAVPAGLMVDHLPFAGAGAPALTVMRGHTKALANVHRAGDTAERLTAEGIHAISAVVSATLDALRGTASGPASSIAAAPPPVAGHALSRGPPSD